MNRAYGRKQKNYGLASVVDRTAHQEPIGKILALKEGMLMLVLEQNSRQIKFFDQKLLSFAQVATYHITGLQNSPSGYVLQSMYSREDNSIPKSISSSPIITDLCYSESQDLLAYSTSNKLVVFYRLNPPVFSNQKNLLYGIMPTVLHIYEPEFAVSNIFYLAQSETFVARSTESKLYLLKVYVKMDSFVVSTIAIINQTEHVLCCLELERSRLLATGGLGGNIKVWDIQKKVPEFLITL